MTTTVVERISPAITSFGLSKSGELDPEDDVLIRQQLRVLGIEIDDPESAVDFERFDEADARSEDILRKYLLEIGSVRLLKPQDETTLARRIQAGKQAAQALESNFFGEITSAELGKRVIEGQQAAHQMIAANLRLVVSMQSCIQREVGWISSI